MKIISFCSLSLASAIQDHAVPMTSIINSIWQGSHKPTQARKPEAGSWKHDCGQLVPAFGRKRMALLENPGAGMNPDAVPFVKVLKDGFHHVDCVRDAMYEFGDKFGDNRFQYKMGEVSNSSIVHYSYVVPKEDRENMTPEICFEFCRGLDDMTFFGISNGRDCYCTSYFKPMASDSSDCDSVCQGDASQICGGKTKVDVFSMHMCDTMEEDLKKALEHGDAVYYHLEHLCSSVRSEAETVSEAATDMQKKFGALGDPAAAGLLQKAKVFSGEWLHKADDCAEKAATLDELLKTAEAQKGKDYTNYDVRKAAEDALSALEDANKQSGQLVAELVKAWSEAQPQTVAEIKYLPAVLAQYYSVMYFVDKDFADDSEFPVTCDGDMLGEPLLGSRPEDCALACDANMDCVGFTALAQKGEAAGYTCFLFSRLDTAQYYTGCEDGFLQLRGGQKRNSTEHFSLGGFARFHSAQKVKHEASAQCQQKRASSACAAAREEAARVGGASTTSDKCFLKDDMLWLPEHLPAYIDCLVKCCEDFDPERIFKGFTCPDVLSMQDCPVLVDAYVPEGTMVAHICPIDCDMCEEPEDFQPPKKAPPVPKEIPVETIANAVIKPKEIEPLKHPIQAMCRAKFSKFGGVSLKPDPSGKSSFALKELTKAGRCVYE